MNLVAMTNSWDWRSKRMDVVHYSLYHGNAIRADAPSDPAAQGQESYGHWYDSDLSHPLLLQRSGVYIPSLFMPSGSIVVREELYLRIRNYPGLVFVEAKPSKLINLWKQIGDFSFYVSNDPVIQRNIQRPDMLLHWMPNDPNLFAKFPKCYELVQYNVFKYRGGEPHSVNVSFTMNDHMNTDVTWSCPSSILEAYPVLWGMVSFLRLDLFELIHDAVDTNYFAIKSIEL